jgi:A/G-specific adenine glycosylase
VEVDVYKKFKKLKHAYSHFKITMHAYWCTVVNGTPEPISSKELRWVSLSEIDQYPFPKANKTLIEELKQMENSDLTRFITS